MDDDEKITPISQIYADRGWRAASAEEFDAVAGDLPTDGEG